MNDMITPANKTVVQVFGIRRSGNHAIISWIMDNYDGVVLHLNDVKSHYPDPYDSFCYLNVRGLPFWKCKPRVHSYLKHKLKKENEYTFAWWDSALKLHYIKTVAPKDCLIISHEDQLLEDEFLSGLSENHQQYLGKTERFVRILLLRDAHNLFASLIKSQRVNHSNIENYINLYKQYATHCIECQETDNKVDEDSPISSCFVSYNSWFLEAEYRQLIAQKVGFSTDGKVYSRVPKEGGGSTFNGRSMDGQAHNLKVLERWKSVVGHPLYEQVLRDEDLLELSNRLFGEVTEVPRRAQTILLK